LNPTPSTADSRVTMRVPTLDDGAGFWRMVRDSGALDLNSPYAYLMWCDHFADSSIVAEVDGEPAGFIMGFHPPGREHVLFVWQVAVSPTHRGLGLGSRMLDALVARTGATAVEATVTPSNTPSQRLFRSLARRAGCECRETAHIEASHFPAPEPDAGADSAHEPEVLFHIGPIPSER